MPEKAVVAILFGPPLQKQVLDASTVRKLKRRHAVRWPKNDKVSPEEARDLLAEADGCMTCWGSPNLSEDLLSQAPKLRMLAHAAGSVKPHVSDALWARGIVVTSAAASIGIDVAQYAVALMVLARKKFMPYALRASGGTWGRSEELGLSNELRASTVGIIGASHVGRNVLRLLKGYDVDALLYDPYCAADQAKKLGAEKVELDELFRRADVVSVHAPSIPETRHIVNAARLALLKDGATLINTSRGTLVDEAALVEELRRRRIWAYLDVTDPEPPPVGSPLFNCPNLTLTPHFAGTSGSGRVRLGALAAEELQRFFQGKPPLHAVTKDMLARIG